MSDYKPEDFNRALDKLIFSQKQLHIVRMDPIECEALIFRFGKYQDEVKEWKEKYSASRVLVSLLNIAILILVGLDLWKRWHP